MSIDSHLIHRCTIRRVRTQKNPYNEPARISTTNVATGVHCRLVISTQQVLDSAEAKAPRVTRYKLLLPSGTAVQQGDEVASLTYEDGSVVAETFSIEAILPRRARTVRHITCELKRVS